MSMELLTDVASAVGVVLYVVAAYVVCYVAYRMHRFRGSWKKAPAYWALKATGNPNAARELKILTTKPEYLVLDKVFPKFPLRWVAMFVLGLVQLAKRLLLSTVPVYEDNASAALPTMPDQPHDEPQSPPEPPEPRPDLELIGYLERGYAGPRETRSESK
jgi:hypothetical protein